METFIVLGLCFILYEALDLFQSCYNKERHQQRQQESSFAGSASGSGTDCVAANRAVSDSFCVNKDTAHLLPLDAIEEIELDSDDNDQSNHYLDHSKIYSICDRVINQHSNNNNTNVNNNIVCVDASDKLIVGWRTYRSHHFKSNQNGRTQKSMQNVQLFYGKQKSEQKKYFDVSSTAPFPSHRYFA